MKRNDISTGELLEAMINGKCEDWNKLDFKMYLEGMGLNNRESLQLLLEEIDNKIREFHDCFFFSEYDKYQHGVRKYPKEVTREFEDYLDSLYHEEVAWEQAGKKRYTLDSLYQLMNEQNLFFNEAHKIAVNSAYNKKNYKLLRRFYEEYVLRNAHEFRDYVKQCIEMLESPSLERNKKIMKKTDDDWGAVIGLFCHYTRMQNKSSTVEDLKNILSMFGNPIQPKSLRNAINKQINDPIHEPTDTLMKNNNRRRWLSKTFQYLKKFEYNTEEIENDIAKFAKFK